MNDERNDVAPTPGNTVPPRKVNEEDVRAGYQTAVHMAVYDGQLSWQVTGIFVQFAILMIAGAVFPAFIGTKDQVVVASAGLAVSLAGIVMTSMFGSMVMRVRTYEEYWVLRAIQLESYLDNVVETLRGSAMLSRNRSISVGRDTVHMRRTSAVKTKLMLGALFLFFLITFTGLLGLNVWRLKEVTTMQPAEAQTEIGPTPPGVAAPGPAPTSPKYGR